MEEPVHGPRNLLLRQEPLVVAAERGQGLGVGGRPEAEAQLVEELGDELGLVVVYRNYTCFVLIIRIRVRVADDQEVARDLRGASSVSRAASVAPRSLISARRDTTRRSRVPTDLRILSRSSPYFRTARSNFWAVSGDLCGNQPVSRDYSPRSLSRRQRGRAG